MALMSRSGEEFLSRDTIGAAQARPSMFGKKTSRLEPLLLERQRWFVEADYRYNLFSRDESGTIWNKELTPADDAEIKKRAQNEFKTLMAALDDGDKFFSYFFLPENLWRFHKRHILLEQTGPAVITEKLKNERYLRSFMDMNNKDHVPVKFVFSYLPLNDDFQRAKDRAKKNATHQDTLSADSQETTTMNWSEYFQKYLGINHMGIQIGGWIFDWQEPGVVIPRWCYDPMYSHFFKNSPSGLQQTHIHKDLVFPIKSEGECVASVTDVKKICKKIAEWNRYWVFSERSPFSASKKVSNPCGFAEKILTMANIVPAYKPDGYLDVLMNKLRNNAQLGTDAIRLYDLATQKEIRVLSHSDLIRYYQLQMRASPNGPVDPELQLIIRAVEHLLDLRTRIKGDTKNVFFRNINFDEEVVISPELAVPIPSPPLVELPDPVAEGGDTSKLMTDRQSDEEIDSIMSRVKFGDIPAFEGTDMIIAHYKKRISEYQRELQAEKVARRQDRTIVAQKVNEFIAQRLPSQEAAPVSDSEFDDLLNANNLVDNKTDYTSIPNRPFKSFKDLGFAEDMNSRHRRSMEDGHCMIDRFGGLENSCFFGVYDGHGGRQAVDYVQSHLHSRILDELRKELPWLWSKQQNFSFDSTLVKKAISAAYARTDDELKELGTEQNGTTVITCWVLEFNGEKLLFSSNAGDARIVMCRDGQPLRLTKDHKPGEEDEIKRIKESGGFVAYNRVNGILGVSRSLGDHAMKEWVIGTPDHSITTSARDSTDFIILACDGLWDVMSDKDAVDFVNSCFAEFAKAPPSTNTSACQDAARKLLSRSLALGTRDNVSIVVVKL